MVHITGRTRYGSFSWVQDVINILLFFCAAHIYLRDIWDKGQLSVIVKYYMRIMCL